MPTKILSFIYIDTSPQVLKLLKLDCRLGHSTLPEELSEVAAITSTKLSLEGLQSNFARTSTTISRIVNNKKSRWSKIYTYIMLTCYSLLSLSDVILIQFMKPIYLCKFLLVLSENFFFDALIVLQHYNSHYFIDYVLYFLRNYCPVGNFGGTKGYTFSNCTRRTSRNILSKIKPRKNS